MRGPGDELGVGVEELILGRFRVGEDLGLDEVGCELAQLGEEPHELVHVHAEPREWRGIAPHSYGRSDSPADLHPRGVRRRAGVLVDPPP